MDTQSQHHGGGNKATGDGTSSSSRRHRPRRARNAAMNSTQPTAEHKKAKDDSKVSEPRQNAGQKNSKNNRPNSGSAQKEAQHDKKDNSKNAATDSCKGSGARPKTAPQNARKNSKSTPVKEMPQGQNASSKKQQKNQKQSPNKGIARGDGNLSHAAMRSKTWARRRSSNCKKSGNNHDPEVLQPFKWQHPAGKQDWWHKEMMKYISSRPENLGKIEQEMKKVNAVISIAGNHVVVSPRILDDKADSNWKTDCETALKEYFENYTVRTLEIDTFDPSQYTNSAVDVSLQRSVGGVLTISVTGPSKLVEQTVYQVKQRSNQVSSKDVYIRPADSPKITPHLKQTVLAETEVKINWDRQNFLKLTGKKNAIKKAIKMINEQLEEANDDLHIAPSHLRRATEHLFQHVRAKAGVLLRWTNPEVLSITGMPRSVEMARQLIVDEIYRIDIRKIPAPGWVLERCNDDVVKAKKIFPEVEIWSEEGFICIRGHPAEIFLVYNELVVAVRQFGEYSLPVKKEFHAALIGKGGNKITEIRRKYNVYVVIPPRDTVSCDILLKGKKTDTIQAKFEIKAFIKQLELQNSTLLVPVSPSDIHRVTDKFFQKLKQTFNAECTTNKDGVLIKGKQDILQKVKDSIMSEISITIHDYVPAEDWLKPMLLESLQEERSRFPEVQISPDCVVDEIVLTGHPSEVKVLGDTMREKVAELEANYDCLTVNMKKKYHRNLIGVKGNNVKKLREQYKVEIIVPPNLSESCGVKVQGPKQGVEAAVRDIQNLVSNLENDSKKHFRFSGEEKEDVARFIKELNPQSLQVKYKFGRNKVTFTGPFDDVECLAAALRNKLTINRQKLQTISIPLNSSQALAVVKSRKNPVLDHLRRAYEGKVKIEFDSAVPALTLKGSGCEMIEAHVKVVERLQEFNDFCMLNIKIDEAEMGKFIGKEGKNIKSLERVFDQVEIVTNKKQQNSNKNVTLIGASDMVENAFNHIRHRHQAARIEYQKFIPRTRHGSSANSLPESVSSYNYEDDDDDRMSVCSSISECVLETESVLYQHQMDVPIVKFVKKSEVLTKKLQNIFSDESVLMNGDDGTVAIVGQTNDTDCWENNVDAKLFDFFEEFQWQQIQFNPRSKFEKIAVDSEDLVVTWDGLTATVCGLKDKVTEKLQEFDSIKNRKRSVCVKLPYEKCLILFMKRKSSMEGTVTSDGSYITLTNEHVEFHSEILEVDSEEEWKSNCKKALNEIFNDVAYRKVQVPAIYSGQMRTECCQRDEYFAEWIQDESVLLIYGLKQHVIKETKRLEDVLFDLKNKKKNVSLKYQCENAEILAFIKESMEHFEYLVKFLADLGSPVLDADSDIIMVNGEILETKSTTEWEEKCKVKIEQCLLRYKVVRIHVEDDIRTQCISLAKSRHGVVTRWVESEGALCIIGIKKLVEVSEQSLRDKINKLHEEKMMFTYTNNESMQLAVEEIESSITVQVDDAVMQYLELEQPRKSLQDVTLTKTSDGVKITGKGRSLQKAKEFVDSIFAEDLLFERFGVYGFLKEASPRWQIEFIEMENNCSVHIKRLPDLEFGDQKFILLPKSLSVPVIVKVEEGDITDADVDLIVNTTNKSFSFDGPLSRYMFQKAGDSLRYLIKNIDHDLQYSEGGSLKCKMIFHAAIPNTSESMEDLLLKILRKADEMEMKSIAMPTIGAGNGGWKSQDISLAMQNAFTRFAPESNNLKVIKVVLFSGMSTSEKQPFHMNVKIRTKTESVSSPVREERGFFSLVRSIFRRSEPAPVQEMPPKPVASTQIRETHESQHARVLIAATNQADLDKAVDEIQKLTSHYIQEFEFDQMTVLRINQSDLDALEKMANELNVRIIVNKERDVHKIIVQGKLEGASKVKDKVQEILAGASSDMPTEWIQSEEKMISVPLDQNSAEYQDIKQLFLQGNKRQGLTLSVSSICRIQNPALYRQYQSKKGEIANRDIPPETIEMRLFHGTDENTISLICRDGFNRSYAGRNATAYGKGTYFSTESSYSNSYTRADTYRRRQMFVADVLTGDYCTGNSSMIDAPRNPATQELYDSVVDQSGLFTPTIYVVFRDWSAYPSYVITYTAS